MSWSMKPICKQKTSMTARRISVDAAEQLKIIMKEPRIRALELREWANSFAELHGIDRSGAVGPVAAVLARAQSTLP